MGSRTTPALHGYCRRLLLAAALPFAIPLQGPPDKAAREFERARIKVLIEAGQRHLNLGTWARNAGLVQQASAELALAVEESEYLLPGATAALSLMRKYDDAIWKKGVPKPTPALLERYDRDARKARLEDRKDRLRLANDARALRLADVARAEFLALIRSQEELIRLDGRGRVVLDAGALPDDIAREVQKEAIEINGQPFVRDAFLALLPDVKSVFEVRNERLLVRCETRPEDAAATLAIASALFPILEEDLGGRPTRRINLFLFKERATYERWLDAAGLSGHKAATGLADLARFTAVACTEGVGEEQLRMTVLHELTHLFVFGLSRAILPSWYSEGLAETYGGEGTFTWKEGRLETRGLMVQRRIEAVVKAGAADDVSALLAGDALRVLGQSREDGTLFYSRAWAFVRFLRTGAGKDVAERFADWEIRCRGGALGAMPGRGKAGDRAPADELFRKMFEKELPGMGEGFARFLAGL